MEQALPRHSYVAALPRISRSAVLIRAAVISFLVGVVLFAGLTLQMTLGADPVLGPSEPASTRASSVAPTPSEELSLPALNPTPSPVPVVPAPVQTSVS